MDLESRLRLQASALAPSFCQLAILATFLRLLLLLCVCVSHSVASDSLQPHRFLCPLQPLQQPGSSVRGILQARILQEWVSISFSRGSFWLRDQTLVSCTAARFFTAWAIRGSPFFFFFFFLLVVFFVGGGSGRWHITSAGMNSGPQDVI